MNNARTPHAEHVESKREHWLHELHTFLLRSLGEEGTPVLDVRFLLRRVQDTMDYKGQIRDASLRELSKELGEINELFPSFLPPHLLAPPKE